MDALDLASGEQKTLIKRAFVPRFLPLSADRGYIVFLRETTLFGVGFDPRRLQLLGTEVPLLDDVDGAGGQDTAAGNSRFQTTES